MRLRNWQADMDTCVYRKSSCLLFYSILGANCSCGPPQTRWLALGTGKNHLRAAQRAPRAAGAVVGTRPIIYFKLQPEDFGRAQNWYMFQIF